MNSLISNLIILTADVNDDNILGTAIDGDIKVLFAVVASEVNQRLFLPEANLVVSGKFRLGRDACTVGISIATIVAVVSLPIDVPVKVAAPIVSETSPVETQIASTEAPAKSKRKTSTTRSKKTPKIAVAA